MFNKKDLVMLIAPLIVEQFLSVAVGMADILMISYAGEAAVSGVSLVDSINNLIIQIFMALATGGAVVCAQYLGRNDEHNARLAANQLMIAATAVSILLMAFSLVFRTQLIKLIFQKADPDVIHNAETFFLYSAFSYPFIAVYNTCAALFRSMGNSRISMVVSFIMNILNIAGNALFLYGFNMGVKGVGISSLISRAVAAVLISFAILNDNMPIYISGLFSNGLNFSMIKKIMGIGIPNSLENSMFQLGKLLVQGIVSSLGTAAIAANAVAGTISSFAVIPGNAMSMAMIPVVGQTVGAGDYKLAARRTKLLIKITYAIMGVHNIAIMLLVKKMISFYNVSEQASLFAVKIIVIFCAVAIFIWPLSFPLPNALRAASDVKYTMVVSIISMWVCRIGLSYILIKHFNIGVTGVWYAMMADWVVRSIAFVARFISGKWKNAAKA